MKKFLVVVLAVLFLVGFGSICGATQPEDPGSNGNGVKNRIKINSSIKNDVNVKVNPKITTTSTATIEKGAIKNKNAQTQSQNNEQTIAPVQETITNNPREAIAAPTIITPNASILSGKIFKYDLLPKFSNKALAKYNGEPVKSILFESYGNIFSRITVEELPTFLIEKAEPYKDRKDVRTDVICKDAGHGMGLGFGGGSAITAADGNTSSGTTVGISGAFSVVNPYCVVWIYEIDTK
jgi:hypothetical protein